MTALIDARVVLNIKARIAQLTEEMADGSARSFEEYRWYCGRLEGMKEVLTIAKEIEASASEPRTEETW
jgi:hypothetical protein